MQKAMTNCYGRVGGSEYFGLQYIPGPFAAIDLSVPSVHCLRGFAACNDVGVVRCVLEDDVAQSRRPINRPML